MNNHLTAPETETELQRPSEIATRIGKWNQMAVEAEAIEKKLTVTNDIEMREAIDMVSTIKQNAKDVETVRVETVAPANSYVKRVNNMFKPLLDSFTLIEGRVKGKILYYQQEKQRRALEEQRKQEEAHKKLVAAEQKKAAKKGVEAPIIAPPPAILPDAGKVSGSVGSSTMSKRWVFEVVDVTKVPARFLMVDGPAVNAAIRAGERTIPGLKVFQQDNLSIR